MLNFPPTNFVPAESKVEGIELFKPAPVEEDAYREVVDFKCPQCGATTAFSVSDGGLKCTHCGHYEAPQSETVGKGAQRFEFTLETMERATHGWGEARKALGCQNCGAQITIPVGALTTTCPFCASNKVIHREAAQDVLRPKFLVPFKIKTQECQKIAREWLGSTWMTPKKLQKLAKIADFVTMYIPFWTFDAIATAEWRAEVGHIKKERYFDRSDLAWKTRTKTVWRWEFGNAQIPYDDVLIQGTKHISSLLLERIKQFRMDDLVPYDPKFLAGLQAQAFDIPLERAWEQSRAAMRENTREACIHQASSSKIRNFSMNLDFEDEAWRYILLPIYVASYSYGGRSFQALVNGQNGAISGQRPVDWNKIWLVIAAMLLPGIFLGIIGLVTLLFAGIGMLIGGFGLVLLVIGLVISMSIFQKAQGLDDV